MIRATKSALAVLLIAAALAGGDRLDISAAAEERQPLYYQDPSGKSDYSPTPKKDAVGRDYVPVYDDTGATPAPASAPASSAPAAGPSGERKILYYRNPMGLPDTSPVPKKDSMGMDYIPVYADAAGETGIVKINPERIQMLGVRTEAAARRNMAHTVRAIGTVAADERRIGVVNPKFEGWIEKLYVNTTGQTVKRGEALFEVYSPDLVLAQREYLVARAALRRSLTLDGWQLHHKRKQAEDRPKGPLGRLADHWITGPRPIRSALVSYRRARSSNSLGGFVPPPAYS